MAAREDVSSSALESELMENHETWMEAIEKSSSKVDILQDNVAQLEESVRLSVEDSGKEMEILRRRVRTTTTLLTYLKSTASTVATGDLSHLSLGIDHQEGGGLFDENHVPVSGSFKSVDMSLLTGPHDAKWMEIGKQQGLIDEHDGAYFSEILNYVQTVTGVMESLARRALNAETESAIEKEKVTLSQEEIQRKAIQIENMSLKLEEMERFALGTNSILNEMRKRVEDLVEETTRQKQKASENEQELCRVKRDFESLKSYVKSLISVRETLISSEKQFQTIERLFERLVAKTTQLEGEKLQKEAEVQKLMEEKVRLMALMDKKEAQLLAMNEQCKMMALSSK